MEWHSSCYLLWKRCNNIFCFIKNSVCLLEGHLTIGLLNKSIQSGPRQFLFVCFYNELLTLVRTGRRRSSGKIHQRWSSNNEKEGPYLSWPSTLYSSVFFLLLSSSMDLSNRTCSILPTISLTTESNDNSPPLNSLRIPATKQAELPPPLPKKTILSYPSKDLARLTTTKRAQDG